MFLSRTKRNNPDYRSGVSFFAFLLREFVNMDSHLKYNSIDNNDILVSRQVGILDENCCTDCRNLTKGYLARIANRLYYPCDFLQV